MKNKEDLNPPITDQSNEGIIIRSYAGELYKAFVPSPLDILRMMAQLVFECQGCGWCCIQIERYKDGQGEQAAIQSLMRATSIKLRGGGV